ncbi:UDP-N-acetylmuramate dehydrogenase [Niameybacter massiliensis]|uniref:UDP-N-acetylenolpyruvoylglucosamine reductase n=1 Tax=Holtiella tumoricola TaxID=3018743 RepID=A0AA42J1E3_9FIRM|nr:MULTISPECIES: UDP-N-acetylmuramate dehydrogenase [Lachnospirales]MDA3732153.1 UDP-N-acetylmuramate dehydrogenase [Holtiella tumoricola]
MNKTNIIHLLAQKINKTFILENEWMNQHTTFKIGGPADLYVVPQTEEELMHAIKVCKQEQIPYYVIGNGSNLLVTDKGYRGVIIEVYKALSDIEVKGNCITAYAGALLSRIANSAYDHSLTGFEFAHGIPGTLGGAVTMNAGAYDGEMKGVLVEATIIDENGVLKTLSLEELKLGYRTSIVGEKGYTVVKATIKLESGDQDAIKAKMKDLMQRRRDKQPLEYPSAGSTFKRPEGHFAGKLIMDSDLRGYQVGGAQVSEKHCGFVINTGGATYEDIKTLIENVQKCVKEKFNVQLETEVKVIGEK